VQSCLPSLAAAIRSEESPETGTPAATIVVRAAGLRVHGMTVTAGDGVPSAGEPAVFCRPVIAAPAVVRRDGTVLADAWLPDLVRLGELVLDGEGRHGLAGTGPAGPDGGPVLAGCGPAHRR